MNWYTLATRQVFVLAFSWTSLSEPHTWETSLCICVCVCMLVPISQRKWVHSNISQTLNAYMYVRVRDTADFSISVDGTAVSKEGNNSILEGPIQCDTAICSACMTVTNSIANKGFLWESAWEIPYSGKLLREWILIKSQGCNIGGPWPPWPPRFLRLRDVKLNAFTAHISLLPDKSTLWDCMECSILWPKGGEK